MKPFNFRSREYVPWMGYPLALFSILVFSFQSNLFSQKYNSPGSVRVNNTNPVYLRMNEVNSKASRHFRDHFLIDRTEKWTREHDSYIASFNESNITTKVYYDLKGSFEYQVRYYGAYSLDNDIKFALQRKFEGYEIKSVVEINNLEKRVYFVKIANSVNIKTVKFSDGRMEVLESFINGGI
jgi:hypothetical protein